jgi:hypothetical protein
MRSTIRSAKTESGAQTIRPPDGATSPPSAAGVLSL